MPGAEPIITFSGTWEDIVRCHAQFPPGSMIEVRVFEPPTEQEDPVGDFGGRSVAEAMEEIGFECFGPPDLAARAKEYLAHSQFGDNRNRRDFGS